MGELLDRAITLFVRNAWLFIALAALVYVPVAIAQLGMGDFWKWYLDTINASLSSPQATPVLPAGPMLGRVGLATTLTFLFYFTVGPLAIAATAHACSNLINGASVSFQESLRFALSRWGRVLLFLILWVFASVAVFIAMGMVLGMLGALGALARSLVFLPIAAIVLAMIAMLVFSLLAVVIGGVGVVTAVVESKSAFDAFGAGIGRTMNRQFFWRSVLMGLVLAAIGIGFAIVTSAVGFGLLAATRSFLPMIAINAVVAIVQFAFGMIVIVLYYYDIRVRREGVDLATLAGQLSHG